MHGEAAAQILPQTGVFTGVIANAGNNAGQGQVPLKHLAGLALLAFSYAGHEGAHIQIKRTGHPATGRTFLCAVRLYFVQTLLIHHGDCSRWLGADWRCGKGRAARIAAENTNRAFRDTPESPAAKTLHTVAALMAWRAVNQTKKHGAGIWGEPLFNQDSPQCLQMVTAILRYLGMAANTFSGRAGKWRTRAPQAL